MPKAEKVPKAMEVVPKVDEVLKVIEVVLNVVEFMPKVDEGCAEGGGCAECAWSLCGRWRRSRR